jgi:hypothetical protein
LYALCATPKASAQVQCVITYRCPNLACKNVLGAWSEQRTANFPSASQCQTSVSQANKGSGLITSCSCRSIQPQPIPSQTNATQNGASAPDPEQQRRDAEEQQRKAEEQKHQQFIRDRDATVLRGDTDSTNAGGIRGLADESESGSGNTGIRGIRGPDPSSTLGVKSNPSNVELRSVPTTPPAKVTSALDQASSASKSGEDARTAVSPEEKRTHSGYQFDDQPRRQPDHVEVPRWPQTPATAGLLAHIPKAAWGDKKIQERVAWYDKHERAALEKQGNVAELQKQIDSGKGDQAVLAAQKSTLVTQLNEERKLQKIEVDAIKQQLVSDQLSWIEKPPQGTSKTIGKP